MTISFTDRPYTPADLGAVCAFLNAVSAADRLRDTYTEADLAHEFQDPGVDLAHDLRLWEQDGQLIAFGQVWTPSELSTPGEIDPYFYLRIHPEARTPALEEALRVWGFGRTRAIGDARGLRARVITSAREHETKTHALFGRWQMQETRRFYRMSRDLHAPIAEPALPAGYHVRPTTPNEIDAWVECFNASFVDHWNHHPLTVADVVRRRESPDHRPELDLVAVAPDGTLAGFASCAVHPHENEQHGENAGHVHLLGTRRGQRGIGLGRALLLSALQTLRADGRDSAVLGVDAENQSGALGLYERAGFAHVSVIIIYQRDLTEEHEEHHDAR